MKKTILTITGILIALATFAGGNGDNNKLTVNIKNFKNTDGKVKVTLFDSEANFLSKGTGQEVSIEDKSMIQVVFENVAPGTYAVSIIHDENGNGDLDTGAFGIPTEDYGFSNNAKGMFGPPSFEDTKFEVTGDKEVVININK